MTNFRAMEKRTAKGSAEPAELTKLQQTAARRVAESKATIPHLYLDAEVPSSALAGRAGPGALAVAACARALRERPLLNSAYRDGALETYSRINVAISVAAQGSVLSPTIFDADGKPAEEIAAEIEALAARARSGELSAPELSGATFTVIDLSGTGAGGAQAVISPSQAAVLTLGDPACGPRTKLGLSCDNRIAPWPDAAAFLSRVRTILEAPPS